MNMKKMKVPNVPGGGAASALMKLGVIGGIGLYVAGNSLYNVEGGHRAIVFNRLVGVKDKVYPEGTHFVIPWFERSVIYDVRLHPHLVVISRWFNGIPEVNQSSIIARLLLVSLVSQFVG
ncbi:unnamed protein product [Vicia faba]|uniref:Prohibitin n=1 Tax=Vicia faba TaxID=3906 RepID=A0AAV1ALQ6_VICFA|nr:unnamed protein product [Vicia faba]